jgi:DNA-binding IclR family transcriptional regulator
VAAHKERGAARQRQGIQSVEVGSTLLEVLACARGALSLRDLSARAKMSPSKAHRYLVSLVRIELFAQDIVSGHYGFGPLAIAMGLTAMRSIDVIKAASESLVDLRDKIDETVMLLIWGTEGPLVYRFEESSRPVFMNVRIGSTVPLLTTAAGRVFMTYLPRAQVWPIVRRELASAANKEHQRAVTEEAIPAMIEQTRTFGMAGIVGDFLPGISALAAPVFDYKSRVVAVVGALGRAEELSIEFDDPAAMEIKRIAQEISRRLGYTPAD